MPKIALWITLMLTAYPMSAEADELQRFFFTPEERQALTRHGSLPTLSNAAPPTAELTVNGVVRRKSGINTAWINGASVTDQTADGTRLLPLGANSAIVPLQLPNGQQVNLKVGQTYDKNTGQTRDSYQLDEQPKPTALSTGSSEKPLTKTEAGKAAKKPKP